MTAPLLHLLVPAFRSYTASLTRRNRRSKKAVDGDTNIMIPDAELDGMSPAPPAFDRDAVKAGSKKGKAKVVSRKKQGSPPQAQPDPLVHRPQFLYYPSHMGPATHAQFNPYLAHASPYHQHASYYAPQSHPYQYGGSQPGYYPAAPHDPTPHPYSYNTATFYQSGQDDRGAGFDLVHHPFVHLTAWAAIASSIDTDVEDTDDPSTTNDPPGSPRRAESLTPPGSPALQPTTGTRRPCSESDALEAQQEAKRLKKYAGQVCKGLDLDQGALDTFSTLPISKMLISIQATLMAMRGAAKVSAAREFLDSPKFTRGMKDRLRVVIMSPNLTYYIIELAQRVYEYIKKNPHWFKIPEEVFQDPEMSAEVYQFVVDNLTVQRGVAKQKLLNSLTSKANIGAVARSLASPSHELTTAHWRVTLSNFITVVADCAKRSTAQKERSAPSVEEPELAEAPVLPSDATPRQIAAAEKAKKDAERIWVMDEYWQYVDCLLGDLREEARATAKVPGFFTACLQNDLKLYSVGTSSLPAVLENVTVNWQRAIQEGLVW
ncbi:hypothetical protein BJ138DRAFT_1105706 [Hygrophoropsis aurantiaca]|uniref:Uncharacterized protein n=1 Tax=Hygrophoropsis aurantiaca TaxID=72124 RepID=A0ACB7ZYL5_9AGAM|nr:hypothetical protein BJ138DRAFT_1105706 [Hygrophoropsis aurantiaca]